MTRISWTICPSGAGHAVRSLRVLAALLAEHADGGGADLSVAVAISPATLATLRPPHTDVLADRHVTVLDDVLVAAAGTDRSDVAWLDGWLPRWRAEPTLADADLVVSDNLTAMLAIRPDTVLLGSFLWSDKLRGTGAEGDAVAAAEDALLAAHRPLMLTTADVAHPGTARTEAVGLPWFADRVARPTATEGARPSRLHLAGGATGRADALLARAAAELDAQSQITVVPTLAEADVVVCRPGLGSVTESVRRATPMVLLHEDGDPELAHTATALERQGLAVDAGSRPEAAAAAALDLLRGPRRDAMVTALIARPTGGHRLAARRLAAHLH